ncbi:hypothetical protein GS597_15660 [Synechococcales cyanobacterium C]|uniref:Uncharacterized protein n=1 Tax=Petrachloros mirabilis ULC683 TaxID=2781853 RepID=A0A8K2A171_9CYAN|nr:DUF6463 family protein [Petrachloros mirabilis]NCJ07917.1 hypothetical protein [Petrachloros mirabilis ULC683]
MEKINGLAIIAIALLHSLLGLIAPGLFGFDGIWQEIASSGVVDAVKPDSLRIWGYYWFLISGFLLMLYGCLCYWVEHHLSRPLPAFAGWGLLAIALFGIGLDLDTGFWLVLPVATNILVAARAKAASLD